MLSPEEVRPHLKNDEAAAELGIRPGTLKTWRSQGKGPPFVRLNGAIRYDRYDLAAYVGANRVHPGKSQVR